MDFESLSEKLRRMGVQIGVQKPLETPRQARKPIETVVPGREYQTNFGSLFSLGHSYPQDYLHGRQPVLPQHPIYGLARWSRVPELEQKNLDQFIFLDTETTGLSGGTGTMAFMVGVARFRGESLAMEQFFLRSPAEEAALLAGLEEFCDGMAAVVTYNGKSFDIPILNTRYILQGFTSPFEDLPHLDLLHLTRRIWRARLEQCNLGNIEQQILQLQRDGDEVPGYLVPEYYAQYLRDGNAEPLRGIFYHNEQDVLSLAALFALFADMLEAPTAWETSSSQDLTALGRLLEHMGEVDGAVSLYQKGAQTAESARTKLEPLLAQAKLHKRHGEYNRA
ncbi:MAG TPA: ribonuclease H-like domain-containing protein, partial [Anaerolineaceae bacterium]|nr:ribonuclease H-like domain-containing protein [Anaerolineaceae bacterium]